MMIDRIFASRLLFAVSFTAVLSACQGFSNCEKPLPAKVAPILPREIAVIPGLESKICVMPVEPEPVVINNCPKPQKKKKVTQDIPVIGQTEEVIIMPIGLVLNARIDTGATTSSLGVEKIEYYERDGKPWVKFEVKDPKTDKLLEFNLKRQRRVKIKQHDREDDRRPVVKLRVILGKIDQIREFTLADRSEFKYPVLIGRNYLMATAIVDVSQKNIVRTTIPN